jgi:hypothetical protein
MPITIQKSGQSLKITNYRLPFTDYRGQGQTVNPVVIDIGLPLVLSGGLTSSDALSQGQSHQNISSFREIDEGNFTELPSGEP